jgi:hypothetical protein
MTDFFNIEDDLDTGINPYTGKPAKFKMDKFFGKDMHLPRLTDIEVQNWFDWWKNNEIINFKYNESEFNKNIEAIPLIEQRPPFFSDQEAIDRTLAAAALADKRMEENEKLAKKKRKFRLALFHACLLEYLNTACGSEYKIKWPKVESASINKTDKIDKTI